jgi:DNA-binding NtrC family response regulator
MSTSTEKLPMSIATILAVDDSPDTLELIRRNLELGGHKVYTASNVHQALDIIDSVEPDIVITDWKMPVNDGMDLVKYIHSQYPGLGVMMVTGYASIESAIQAVKSGVDEYLPKPFTDEELATAINRLIAKVKKRKTLTQADITQISSFGLIGQSAEIHEVFDLIKKAAVSQATVLITGESGTGKELVARAIHYQSKRSNAPFVTVNCSAIPNELIESELFGYTKGAFTGAVTTRAGFFQTANGGSIFLDEVSEMSLNMQVKLLRVIQEKEVTLVGSRKPLPVDIRIIAASNKNLKRLVEAGSFREDLYYRLNIVTIEIPPLRDRKDDIVYLINHFTSRFAREAGKNAPVFSDDATDVLLSYDFPGNVRELENIVQRLIVVSDSEIIFPSDLPAYMRSDIIKASDKSLRSMSEVESEHIQHVVEAMHGNLTRAASILGMDRKTLRTKLKQYTNKPD